MWSSNHQLRCSAAYISRWQCFLKQVLGVEGHPNFYQSVGNAVFEKFVKEKCPVSESAGAEQQHSITAQELNALRYAAGYIPIMVWLQDEDLLQFRIRPNVLALS